MFFIEVVAAIVTLMLGFESHKLDLYRSSYGLFHSQDCHSLGCLIVYVQNLELVFGWKTEGIWTHILHRSCRYICELDVRLLNHPNWTSKTQVMVHLIPGITTAYAVYLFVSRF